MFGKTHQRRFSLKLVNNHWIIIEACILSWKFPILKFNLSFVREVFSSAIYFVTHQSEKPRSKRSKGAGLNSKNPSSEIMRGKKLRAKLTWDETHLRQRKAVAKWQEKTKRFNTGVMRRNSTDVNKGFPRRAQNHWKRRRRNRDAERTFNSGTEKKQQGFQIGTSEKPPKAEASTSETFLMKTTWDTQAALPVTMW